MTAMDSSFHPSANATAAPVSRELHIQYFAMMREERGLSRETLSTTAATPRQLFQALAAQHAFSLNVERLKVSVNSRFVEWDTPLSDQDTVVFIPPVAGG